MTSCVVLMIRWVLGFAVTNLFETLEHDIGVDNTYYIFGVICFVGKGGIIYSKLIKYDKLFAFYASPLPGNHILIHFYML